MFYVINESMVLIQKLFIPEMQWIRNKTNANHYLYEINICFKTPLIHEIIYSKVSENANN